MLYYIRHFYLPKPQTEVNIKKVLCSQMVTIDKHIYLFSYLQNTVCVIMRYARDMDVVIMKY